uniref:7TM GPCR serpentine receptor class x (Srx) domain-containing protein n=1 Tax=Plectus sambesii TaxID=2011161 RepID=A0A914WTL7_9BILA
MFAALYGLLFVAVYASPYGHIVFHSGYGIYWWPKTDTYGIKFTTFNNTAVAVLVPLGYLILWLVIRRRKSKSEILIQTSQAEQRLQVQAILICVLTCTASLFYYLAPKFTSNVVVFQVLHVIWISSNGSVLTRVVWGRTPESSDPAWMRTGTLASSKLDDGRASFGFVRSRRWFLQQRTNNSRLLSHLGATMCEKKQTLVRKLVPNLRIVC